MGLTFLANESASTDTRVTDRFDSVMFFCLVLVGLMAIKLSWQLNRAHAHSGKRKLS